MKKDFISLQDYSSKEIEEILDLTAQVKKNKSKFSSVLKGKSIGLLFQKPSNRTRVSFEVGIYQLGGNCIYLGPDEINLGVRESTYDVSKTLSRYLDGIIARTHTHKDIIELSKNATVPVINGLSDFSHPCQGLTDVFSVWEKFKKLKGLTIAYVGDGNNVCHSLMLAAGKTGMNVNVATPKGYEPDKVMVDAASLAAKKFGAKVLITDSAVTAVKNADVVYSDVWVSMGQETETKKRIKIFKDYQINEMLVSHANKNYIFMHCLPAHRGLEVTEGVIDGKNSVIFDQAENRLHTQKAILIYLLTKSSRKQ